MAQLPSLALGLGLQGKPIDRAALNLRRAEGEERAALRAQQKAQKELEPYKRRIFAAGDKAYLPVHKEMMSNKVAGVWKYLSENGENVNYQELGNMIYDIESLSQVAQKEYNQYTKNVNDKNNSLWSDEYLALGQLSDRDAINETLSQGFGLTGQVNPDGTFAIQSRKAVPASDFAQGIIDAEGNNLWQPIGEGELVGKGKSDFIQLRPRAGSIENTTQMALANPDVVATERKLLFNEITNAGGSIDFKDEKQVAEFNRRVNERIATNVRNAFDITKAIKEGKGGINIFTGNRETEKGGILEGVDTDIAFSVGSGKNEQKLVSNVYSSVNFGKNEVELAPSSDTRYVDGTPYERADNVTFGQVGISYVTAKPLEFEFGGRKFTLPSGVVVPKKYEQTLVDMGADIEAKVVAYGVDDDGKVLYREASPVFQSKFFTTSDKKGEYVKSVRERAQEMQKVVDANKPTRKSSRTPASNANQQNQFNLNSNLRGNQQNQQPTNTSTGIKKWEKNKR